MRVCILLERNSIWISSLSSLPRPPVSCINDAMRIRKNAKFPQLSTISTSSLSSNSPSKAHLDCQLNQSPWDIITFPPPPNSSHSSHHFQVEDDFGFAGNGSFGDSIGAIQSPGPPTKIHFEGEVMLNNDRSNDFCIGDSDLRVGLGKEDKIIVKDDDEEEKDTVLFCESDRKGWQCGRLVTKNGHPHKVCAHQLKICKKSNGSEKKSDGTQKRGRGRPPTKKKEPTPGSAENNYDEYYYYSGFGPLWGKKKEAAGRKNNENLTSMSKNEDKNTKTLVPDIDFMECDEDDDDEDGGGEIGKKRGRKRIKARSLKSLM